MVRIVVGALLLVSAILKLHLLLTSADILPSDWMASPRVQWLAVGWESALALWLWSGWNSFVSRWAALATFAIFAAVSLNQAIGGQRTCCCFGAVQAQPWLVFILDLGILAWLYRAEQVGDTSNKAIQPLLRMVSLALAVVILTTGVIAAVQYQPPTEILRAIDWPAAPLAVAKGSQSSVSFRILNPTESDVSVAYYSSSCECLTIGTSSRNIAPGTACDALAIIDLSKKPGFHGDLDIVAKAISINARRPVLEMHLRLIVHPRRSEASQ